MGPESGFRIAPNWAVNWKKWQRRHNFLTWRHHQTFFDVVLFLLITLVTSPIFMSTLSLVLESWQFPVIRDWREIRKSEIPPSEFYPISRHWGELGIPDLAQTSLIKCYWMLRNARVTALTVSELLGENQQGGRITPTQIRVNNSLSSEYANSHGIFSLF